SFIIHRSLFLMDFLTEIMSLKSARLEQSKRTRPIQELRALADDVRSRVQPHALRAALSRESINVIAEFKRASPSKGVIRADAEPSQLARSYDAGGVAVVSVLTEQDCFRGLTDYLCVVR